MALASSTKDIGVAMKLEDGESVIADLGQLC